MPQAFTYDVMLQTVDGRDSFDATPVVVDNDQIPVAAGNRYSNEFIDRRAQHAAAIVIIEFAEVGAAAKKTDAQGRADGDHRSTRPKWRRDGSKRQAAWR